MDSGMSRYNFNPLYSKAYMLQSSLFPSTIEYDPNNECVYTIRNCVTGRCCAIVQLSYAIPATTYGIGISFDSNGDAD